jgi:hypothetical protein
MHSSLASSYTFMTFSWADQKMMTDGKGQQEENNGHYLGITIGG